MPASEEDSETAAAVPDDFVRVADGAPDNGRAASAPWRVALLVPDTPARLGIRALLEAGGPIEVVADGGRALDLAAWPALGSVDLLVLDADLYAGPPSAWRPAGARCGIFLVLDHSSRARMEALLAHGAAGVITRAAPLEEWRRAFERLRAGQRHAPMHLAAGLLARRAGGPVELDPVARLSPREREVLLLIGEGCTSRQAAERLGLSPKTVESHRERLQRKLGAGRGRELALIAAELRPMLRAARRDAGSSGGPEGSAGR